MIEENVTALLMVQYWGVGEISEVPRLEQLWELSI